MQTQNFTFKSGYTVHIQRVNPILLRMAELQDRKDTPKPQPPVSEVPVRGGMKEVVNENDPQYLAGLENWENVISERSAYRTIKMGVIPDSIDQGAVTAFRQEMRSEYGMELDESDVLIFCTLVAVRDEPDNGIEEIQRLQQAILGQAQPTPEAVEQHAESFRGPDQGQGHLAVQEPQQNQGGTIGMADLSGSGGVGNGQHPAISQSAR